MDKCICSVSCSPLRSEPAHQREMVSQVLFGESVFILERTAKDWIRVRCEYDGYEGWCQGSQFELPDQKNYDPGQAKLNPYWAGEIVHHGHSMKIPFGAVLMLDKRGNIAWKKKKLRFKGKPWNPSKAGRKKREIIDLAMKFLDAPYLWGGKTVLGTDCSGFTQTIFRFLNLPLMRDAWQQASMGEPVESMHKINCGDLAFFDNEEGRITHVGIMLNPGKIIHASGKVRIDRLDEKGIINKENGQRTHRLKLIRRYF
jgi:hypothetical protein